LNFGDLKIALKYSLTFSEVVSSEAEIKIMEEKM